MLDHTLLEVVSMVLQHSLFWTVVQQRLMFRSGKEEKKTLLLPIQIRPLNHFLILGLNRFQIKLFCILFKWSIMKRSIVFARARWVILNRASDLKTVLFLSSDRCLFLAHHCFNTFSLFAMHFFKFLSFSSCLLYE